MNSAYLALLDRLDDLSQRIEAFPAISATPPQNSDWESSTGEICPGDLATFETLFSIERRLEAGALLSLELQRRVDSLTSALEEQRTRQSAESRELRAFIDSRLSLLERRLENFMTRPGLAPAPVSTQFSQVDQIGDSAQHRTDRQGRELYGQNVVPLKDFQQKGASANPDLDRTIAELIGSLTAING